MSILRPVIVKVGSDVTENAPQQVNDADGASIEEGFASDANGDYIIPAGTPVWLEFPEALTAEAATVGLTILLGLWSPIEVFLDLSVANEGSPAPVELARVLRDELNGKIAGLILRIQYLQVGSNQIKLRATRNPEPGDRQFLIPLDTDLVEEVTAAKLVLVPKWARFRAFFAETIALPVVADVSDYPAGATDFYTPPTGESD